VSGPVALRICVLGGGPAGRAALARLPGAVLIARPEVTAWHAEPGILWIESAGRIRAEPFDRLLVCADEPLLLASLGCAFANGRLVADRDGRTTVPGVWAAGRVTGAASSDGAARQGAASAEALMAGPAAASVPATQPAATGRAWLDPFDLATLLERPADPARDDRLRAQCLLAGPVRPARPVSLAALADFVTEAPEPRPPQPDAGELA
jgi:hypothetical protein